jgi:hypothetical protein
MSLQHEVLTALLQRARRHAVINKAVAVKSMSYYLRLDAEAMLAKYFRSWAENDSYRKRNLLRKYIVLMMTKAKLHYE